MIEARLPSARWRSVPLRQLKGDSHGSDPPRNSHGGGDVLVSTSTVDEPLGHHSIGSGARHGGRRPPRRCDVFRDDGSDRERTAGTYLALARADGISAWRALQLRLARSPVWLSGSSERHPHSPRISA